MQDSALEPSALDQIRLIAAIQIARPAHQLPIARSVKPPTSSTIKRATTNAQLTQNAQNVPTPKIAQLATMDTIWARYLVRQFARRATQAALSAALPASVWPAKMIPTTSQVDYALKSKSATT